jgi:hypothetical protein
MFVKKTSQFIAAGPAESILARKITLVYGSGMNNRSCFLHILAKAVRVSTWHHAFLIFGG